MDSILSVFMEYFESTFEVGDLFSSLHIVPQKAFSLQSACKCFLCSGSAGPGMQKSCSGCSSVHCRCSSCLSQILKRRSWKMRPEFACVKT
ncbi:hypothetical protein BDV96DRAFT_575595 [Lophiotrema nucula]|uniref:Uncharacterized protein n=1 Tax=Lophiotrema nucula TaxID=690887 RepID=A0A6A5Z7V7_9PLEO|nr:hypothetical protein BDV96DRAFT_575595 [Lophiotrema nucula]